jgi:hypothetical protein
MHRHLHPRITVLVETINTSRTVLRFPTNIQEFLNFRIWCPFEICRSVSDHWLQLVIYLENGEYQTDTDTTIQTYAL